MSDSNERPRKAPAKKATKKATAKKTAKKMSAKAAAKKSAPKAAKKRPPVAPAEDQPDGIPQIDSTEALRSYVAQAVEEVDEALAALRNAPILSGPCSIHMVLDVEEADRPEEAVDMAMAHIARYGYGGITFVVRDRLSGADFFVRGGQTLTEEAVDDLRERVERDD